VIKAGERSAAVTVSPAANGAREGGGTVVLSMGLPTHATQGKTTMSTVTIIDTETVPESTADKGVGAGADGALDPTVEFTSAGSSGEEKAGVARLEAALSAASGKVVRVEYAATGGTAIRGKDYALRGNTLTFNPGETKKTIEIDVANNNVYDDDKTVEVSLKNPQNAVPGGAKTHIYTIVNTAPKPRAAFAVANRRVKQNAGRIVIAVELSAVSGKDAIVPFTVGGTAGQGKDYTMTPSPLVIKAGMRSAEIAITLKGDVVEAGKTVEVRLAESSTVHIGSPGVFSLVIARDTPPVIAIVPFVNVSKKKTAGELVMLHVVKELAKLEDFIIVEPGVVRQHLLSLRIIMYDGGSLPDVELLIKNLDADLVLTGKVFDYQDNEGAAMTPKVDFSVMVIEKTSRKVIWASKSYSQGDDGVTLFDWGTITTANALATEMVRAVRKMMVTW
jgi:TolB-like protein